MHILKIVAFVQSILVFQATIFVRQFFNALQKPGQILSMQLPCLTMMYNRVNVVILSPFLSIYLL